MSAEALLTMTTAARAGIPIQMNGFASMGMSGKKRSESREIAA